MAHGVQLANAIARLQNPQYRSRKHSVI